MIFNPTEQQERAYLARIIGTIKAVIAHADAAVDERVKTLDEQKKYLWENRDIDPHEIRQVRENILNVYAGGKNVIARRERLGKMLSIPYFGRIDFREKNKAVQPVYIGVHSFYDFDTKTNYIYDWRAPVSSMYYDYELGAASYLSPLGAVEGDISLKRQYRIRDGRMEYMLESSVTVHDDILQKELSSPADDKMKNMVATIQREQNRIIRNEEAPVLIIQGVAGSGKTSIALHRVAYLLYANKDTLSSKDILIVSPNKVFADYISNVLPELGEETIPEKSMEALLSGVLDNKYKFQTFFDQVSELLGRPAPGLIERIRYKATVEFVSLLDKFLLHVENTYFRATDYKVKHITVPKEYFAEQFRRFHRYALRRRFEVMTDYIAEELKAKYWIVLDTADRNLFKKEIKGMFAGNNDLQVYKDFWAWIGRPEMFRMRKNRMLEYSDLAPLAYIRIVLGGIEPQSKVKHLLVDEMQDYSPIQYKVLNKLFPCRKTILGDASQSVNPYGFSTADMIRRTFASGEVMKLCKSYRSTYEITDFAQKIRANEELEPVARYGEEPRVLKFGNTEDEVSGIIDLIDTFKKSAYKSLGIICKTEEQAAELTEKLKQYEEGISFLSSRSRTFVQGIVITSAPLAKGLEFDEVIIPQANEKNYRSEIDRNMLYVAVTRAMHRLTLVYTGPPTSFIP